MEKKNNFKERVMIFKNEESGTLAAYPLNNPKCIVQAKNEEDLKTKIAAAIKAWCEFNIEIAEKGDFELHYISADEFINPEKY